MRETIVALSSPPPSSLGGYGNKDAGVRQDWTRAIVRLSGPQAARCAEQVFRSAPALSEQIFRGADSRKGVARASSPAIQPSKSLCHAKILTISCTKTARVWRRVSGEIRWKDHILAACAYCMPAPHSYTREDMIELHVPGLSWVVSALLDQLLAAGARLAQPGEFTRRAFEHGRISLAQAEAVGALINSLTADEARVYAARLQTHSRARRHDLCAEIEDLLSLVELGLDFSHEEAGVLSTEEILKRLEYLRRHAEELRAKSDTTLAPGDSACLNAGLPRIVLVGPTNAGKSSLFNALLRRSAAIVSPLAHTTRDFVEAPLTLLIASASESDPATTSVTVLLVDTAGCGAEVQPSTRNNQWLRETAWNTTISQLRSADALLLIVDQSVPLKSQSGLIALQMALRQLKPAGAALLWSKADLTRAVDESAQRVFAAACGLDVAASFSVSAMNDCGLEALRKFLAAQAVAVSTRAGSASFITAAAAHEATDRAAAAIMRACGGLQAGHGEDVVAVELREAVHAFRQAEGVWLRHDAVTEMMLDRIFSKFCIGK
ncbi:MAG: GTPase [Planctomycetota bacterium]